MFGGIIVSILILVMIATWNADFQPKTGHVDWRTFNEYAETSIWALGFAFMIPGVVFIMAALIQHKAAYVTSSVIGLLAVLVLGIVIILCALLLVSFAVTKNNLDCYDTNDGCNCNGDNYHDSYYGDGQVIPFKNCSGLYAVVNLCIGLVLTTIFTWIFLLTASIMAIVYSCRSNPQNGMMYTPLQEQTVNVTNQSNQSQMQPQPMYQPGELRPYPVNPSSVI